MTGSRERAVAIPHFEVAPARVPLVVRARYVPADYVLLVGPNGQIPSSAYRVSVDTLTLYVDPEEKTLVALDAYTNSKRWQRRRLIEPQFSREAALRCREQFDENGIAQGSSQPVHYFYDPDSRVLRMMLQTLPVVTEIRCLDNVGCTLDEHGQLVELWVRRLE